MIAKKNPIKQPQRSLLRDESGATALVVAAMFTVLLAVLGALVDTARITIAQNKLQSSLDAAALAAVRDANTLNLQQEVTKFFNANFPSGYMGMSPSSVSVTQSGNEYTFTVSAPLPRAIMMTGGNSNTLTATAKITTGSSSGASAEIALVLDSSMAMGQTGIDSTAPRLSILKTTVSNLLDKIKNGNNKISAISFNDAVRIDPSRSAAWLYNTPSSTLSSFSAQTASNYGRFDGCMSTKYSEENSTYPSYNLNNYLTNNDDAPSSGKFRQYTGPVDTRTYYHGTSFENYEYSYDYSYGYGSTPFNWTNYYTYGYFYSYGYDYLNGIYGYSSSPPAVKVTPSFFGAVTLRDTQTLDQTAYQSYDYGLYYYSYGLYYYNYSERYVDNRDTAPGFYYYAGEASSYSPLGSPLQYSYVWLDPYGSTQNSQSGSYKYTSGGYYTQTYTLSQTMSYNRTVDLSGRYAYAMKVYIAYKPATSLIWKAYDENNQLLASGNAQFTATGLSPSSKNSYVAELHLGVPFRPFSKVILTYPNINTAACTNEFYYCNEQRKTGNLYRYCSVGSCSVSSVDMSYYDSYDFISAGVTTGPIAYYPTCGTLQQSLFMEPNTTTVRTAVNNLVAGGPARLNVGMNWAFRALSPKWRGLFNTAQAAYPLDFNNGNTKTAVLITQGNSFRNRAQSQNNSDNTYFDDVSFKAVCTNMKAKGIRVFVIGVDITLGSTESVIKSCASSENDYVNVSSASAANAMINRIADSVSTGPSGSIQFQ